MRLGIGVLLFVWTRYTQLISIDIVHEELQEKVREMVLLDRHVLFEFG